jgi:hypothetical protein
MSGPRSGERSYDYDATAEEVDAEDPQLTDPGG